MNTARWRGPARGGCWAGPSCGTAVVPDPARAPPLGRAKPWRLRWVRPNGNVAVAPDDAGPDPAAASPLIGRPQHRRCCWTQQRRRRWAGPRCNVPVGPDPAVAQPLGLARQRHSRCAEAEHAKKQAARSTASSPFSATPDASRRSSCHQPPPSHGRHRHGTPMIQESEWRWRLQGSVFGNWT